MCQALCQAMETQSYVNPLPWELRTHRYVRDEQVHSQHHAVSGRGEYKQEAPGSLPESLAGFPLIGRIRKQQRLGRLLRDKSQLNEPYITALATICQML